MISKTHKYRIVKFEYKDRKDPVYYAQCRRRGVLNYLAGIGFWQRLSYHRTDKEALDLEFHRGIIKDEIKIDNKAYYASKSITHVVETF